MPGGMLGHLHSRCLRHTADMWLTQSSTAYVPRSHSQSGWHVCGQPGHVQVADLLRLVNDAGVWRWIWLDQPLLCKGNTERCLLDLLKAASTAFSSSGLVIFSQQQDSRRTGQLLSATDGSLCKAKLWQALPIHNRYEQYSA